MKKILFMCTGNYYRSRFCEALFNHCACSEEKNWQAFSRGLDVNPNSGNIGAISPEVVVSLASYGVELSPQSLREPMQVQETDLENAHKVIAVDEAAHRPLMDEQFPQWADKIEYWQIKDLDENTTESPLVQLQENIHKLIKQLN